MKTLSQILIESAATLDLSAEEPTGTELTTRTSFANQAVSEAFNYALLREFKERVVTFATTATISLGTNFTQMIDKPREMLSDSSWNEYEPIEPEDAIHYTSSDRYYYVTGNPASGYVAYFNNLAANATLVFTKYRYPSGMSTLTSICELSDPQYVVLKVNASVYKSRNDNRFPIVEAEAQSRLQNMVARSNRPPLGGTQATKRIGSAAYKIN